MTKAAIQSIKHKIKLDQRSNVSLDHIFLEKYLKHVMGYATYYVSPFNSRDKNLPENYLDANITDINEFDEMFLFASSMNFIAGFVPKFVTKTIQNMLKFKGPINIVLIDKLMPLYNYLQIFYDRRRYMKFEDPEFKFTEEDIEKFANLNYRVYYAGLDYDSYKTNAIHPGSKYAITIDKCVHSFLPSAFIFMNKHIELEQKEKLYDICYFGIPRDSYRQKRITNFFNTDQLTKLIIGFSREDLPLTTSTRSMKLKELYSKMQECRASLILGNSHFNENQLLSHRFFESIKCGIISFIDIQYDPNKNLIHDEELKSTLYIETKEQIVEVLNKCKQDPEFEKRLIAKQFKELEKWNHYIHKDVSFNPLN